MDLTAFSPRLLLGENRAWRCTSRSLQYRTWIRHLGFLVWYQSAPLFDHLETIAPCKPPTCGPLPWTKGTGSNPKGELCSCSGGAGLKAGLAGTIPSASVLQALAGHSNQWPEYWVSQKDHPTGHLCSVLSAATSSACLLSLMPEVPARV